jgi:hypothetical protein
MTDASIKYRINDLIIAVRRMFSADDTVAPFEIHETFSNKKIFPAIIDSCMGCFYDEY